MLTFRSVHQFHSGTAAGDAITQQMFTLRTTLRSIGYRSEIFAEHVAEALASEVKSIGNYDGTAEDLLLVHHSIGHTAFDEVLLVRSVIVTVFHSITPARFFQDPDLREFIRLGLVQLRQLASRSVCGIADSNHNRREMLDAGFCSVSVLPVRTDFSHGHASRAGRPADASDWLFVGRVVPNKRQVQLVEAFARYAAGFNSSAKLRLVGDLSMTEYVSEVVSEIERRGLAGQVLLLGKVSETQLWNSYRRSGVFVCMSEHEGFGVPLLEAMASGLPVIASDHAATPETMGGAGILIHDDDPWLVAGIAATLDRDRVFAARLVEHQDRRLLAIENFDVAGVLAMVIAEAASDGLRLKTLQVQGPFETTYSLAVLNREVAVGLDRLGSFDVSIYATEGPGDYTPSDLDLMQFPQATKLYERRLSSPFPDVVIRQMFPPRVDDSPGGLTFQYFGWEESRIPPTRAADFNAHLDGIGAMSTYVAQVLRDSGVTIPIDVIGVGVREPVRDASIEADELSDLRSYRFLHISSAFPRKGVDLLLDAYFACFTGDDDASLILKTFPNPHNDVEATLMRLRSETQNPPHVAWINRDLQTSELDALYGLAACLVHAPRGEGFGLPVAEAMLARVPVISVSATGLSDFVNEETALVVPVTFEPADTHVSAPGSEWAAPDLASLGAHMRSEFRGHDPNGRQSRVSSAHALVSQRFNWPAVSLRWQELIDRTSANRKVIVVGLISTWNSRCGIAEYSRNLVDGFARSVRFEIFADRDVETLDPSAEEFVRRVWRNGIDNPDEELFVAATNSAADVLHLQHNFGFVGMGELSRLLREQSDQRPVVLTLHRTADMELTDRTVSLAAIRDSLSLASAIVVHQEHDVSRLANMGVTGNVVCIPHGCRAPIDSATYRRNVDADSPFVVSTFGFLLPHKGTLELIRAVAQIRSLGHDVRLLAVSSLHTDSSSVAYARQCAQEIQRLNLGDAVRIESRFLEEHEAIEMLQAADAIVLPYLETPESASGALRFVLPLCRPTVVSDLPIFADASDVVLRIVSPVETDSITAAILRLIESPDLREELSSAMASFCRRNSWQETARKMETIYRSAIHTFQVSPNGPERQGSAMTGQRS
jgi:glycosyltransferase involved in cell wall biosynthesis